MSERAFCSPGTRVEVIDDQTPTGPRSGVVLYVGSDAHALVGWDDDSTSVLPQETLLPMLADGTQLSANGVEENWSLA
jgi:hypothetical protein